MSCAAGRTSTLRERYVLSPILVEGHSLARARRGSEGGPEQSVVAAEVAIKYPHLRITQGGIPFSLEDGGSIHYGRGIRALCSQHGKFEFGPGCLSKTLEPCKVRI